MTENTPTRVWINNPRLAEIDLALEHGAVGCTTNPTYVANILKRAPNEVRPIVDECILLASDDAVAVELIQGRLVQRIAERFMPMYEASGGRQGFVSIQGSPDDDADVSRIIAEARAGHGISPNVVPKLPATEAGLVAFEALITEGYPAIVTEVFSLAQLVETCDRYVRVTAETGTRPPFFMSPITGIFGDHLKAQAAEAGLPISIYKSDAELAGIVFARECYRIARDRAYPVTLLCGGSRVPFDLTGLIGAPVHVTINWSTFRDVLDSGMEFATGFDTTIDATVRGRLEEISGDFRLAMQVDGLSIQEFEDFGPVQYFRNNFVAGWQSVREVVTAARRH